MDDGVDAVEVDLVDVAHVALHDRKIGMRLEKVAEPHDVESDDVVPSSEQLGNENAALVAAGASDEYFHSCDPILSDISNPMTDPMPLLPGLSPVAGKSLTAKFARGRLPSEAGVTVLREIALRSPRR